MPPLPKFPPSSLRLHPSLTNSNLNTRLPEQRPYLISASFRRAEVSGMRSIETRSTTLFPHEAEDARLTGSTRSLFRRLLALNLPMANGTDSLASRAGKTATFIKSA
jgi:hypothetical protein